MHSVNGLAKKKVDEPLPEPMWIKVYVTIWGNDLGATILIKMKKKHKRVTKMLIFNANI